MKRVALFIAGFIVLLLAAAFILPNLFKDDIKAAIDAEIAKSVNADVYFDADQISLSLFSNFPNLTVALGDFGVVGRAPFAGDTLAAIQSFEIVLNLASVISGDQIKVNGVSLVKPAINVMVLPDGRANYDIAMPSDSTVTESPEEEPVDESSSELAISVDRWEIVQGQVTYDDQSSDLYIRIEGLNHSGSGDFTLTVFDLVTNTQIENMVLETGGIAYLANRRLDLDLTMAMDLDAMTFTFKDNLLKINDFAFGFEGFFGMPGEDINMDLKFSSMDNSFKSILSLVPAIYLQDFDGLKTSGELDFHGFVKGTYNDTTMPAYNVSLNVSDGMFQYPDLPTPVNNINIDLLVDNPSGNIDQTMVEVKNFHLDLGSNPINGRVLIKNLVDYDTDADVKATIDLAQLNQMFPMEGLEMKGTYSLNLEAIGIYDSVTHMIPKVNAQMALKDGFIKYAEYPIPMEEINMEAAVINESGKMVETLVDLSKLHMLMDGEPFDATMKLTNLDDYTWDVMVNGTIDLEKVTKIFPQEGMDLKGKIVADVKTSGKMSDLDAERYSRLPTSGSAQMTGFAFSGEDLPQGMTIAQANLAFDPGQISLTNMSGTLGKSDIALDGTITNYLAYTLGEGHVLKGQMNFNSNRFNLNEWMVSEEGATDEPETTPESESDTVQLDAVKVPANIDFVLNAKMAEVDYDDLILRNMTGNIVVKDEAVRMTGLEFDLLGGAFTLTGAYTTKEVEDPLFDFDLDVKDLSIAQAFEHFSIVRAFAPIAKGMDGNFSTNFAVNGALGQDLNPILDQVDGAGLIQIVKAGLNKSNIATSIVGATALASGANATKVFIEDVIMQTEIKQGRLWVKPFDVKIGNYQTNVQGSTGINGDMDYQLKMDVPAGQVGAAINTALASLPGGNAAQGQDIKLKLGLTGTYDEPKVKILGTEFGEGGAGGETIVETVVAEQKEELERKANEEIAKQQEEVEKKVDEEVDRLADEATDQLSEEAQEALGESVDEVKDALKGLFGKKKKKKN